FAAAKEQSAFLRPVHLQLGDRVMRLIVPICDSLYIALQDRHIGCPFAKIPGTLRRRSTASSVASSQRPIAAQPIAPAFIGPGMPVAPPVLDHPAPGTIATRESAAPHGRVRRSKLLRHPSPLIFSKGTKPRRNAVIATCVRSSIPIFR